MSTKAAIWDMDGTLIDGETTCPATLEAGLASLGHGPIPDLHKRTRSHCRGGSRVAARCHGLSLGFAGWSALKSELHATRAYDLAPGPGAFEVWSEVSSLGVAQAIASNADRVFADIKLRQIGLNRPGLATVSRTDVRSGNPNPETFLPATWPLGVDPADAVAIENSATGALAAVAAGMRTFLRAAADKNVPVGATHVTTHSMILDNAPR